MMALYTPEVQAGIEQAQAAASVRKVPRHDPIDRAVHNSPPIMDDVGGATMLDFDEKDPYRRELERLLDQRQLTHGDFRDNGRIMQGLKDLVRTGPSWAQMTPYQREGLDMILHKSGRIVCGDPNFPDHWEDLAGYAIKVRSLL